MMTSFNTAFTAFRRAPLLSALSITTIAFSLFAFGLFGLVALNIRAALQRIEERVEIRAFIADSTSDKEIADAADQIAKFPEVLKVDIVTQDEALERAKKELGEFKDVFEAGVLPASLDVKLKPGNRDPASVRRVADHLHESTSSTTFASAKSGSRSCTSCGTSPAWPASRSVSRSRRWP